MAALASWLDARAHGGAWLLRIEDVDAPRCQRAWGEEIVLQLAAHGLHSDEAVLWQSARRAAYEAALGTLAAKGLVYACQCSRKHISQYWLAQGVQKERHGDLPYPGLCRETGLPLHLDAPQLALRLHVGRALQHVGWAETCHWQDRRLGPQHQNITQAVGDFVLRRADACYSYQLAVVADDAAQGISHVVRGEDLLDNTPRQLLLQALLGYPAPQYAHMPLRLAADGQKLSKQNGAQGLAWHSSAVVLAQLQQAALALGLAAAPQPELGQTPAAYLQRLLPLWAAAALV